MSGHIKWPKLSWMEQLDIKPQQVLLDREVRFVDMCYTEDCLTFQSHVHEQTQNS